MAQAKRVYRRRSRRSDAGAKRVIRAAEVARLLYIHPSTVRKWADKGIIPCWRVGPRGHRRFRRAVVLKLLKP